MASKKTQTKKKRTKPPGSGRRPKGTKAADAGVYVRVERDRRMLYVKSAAALGTNLADVARVAWEELVRLAEERAAAAEAEKRKHRQRRIGSDIRSKRKRAS